MATMQAAPKATRYLRRAVGTLVIGIAGACTAATSGDAGAAPEQAASSAPAACSQQGVALQVLGSGGPMAEGDRAATSYLLWIDGTPRLLIDAGSGSFVRYGQAGGQLASLDAILLTHLHADHAGDLVDILNSGGFETRTLPLPVIGPDAAPRFPGTGEFLARLLGKDSGAFAYNGGYLDGSEGKAMLRPQDVPTGEGRGTAVTIRLADDLTVQAQPVHHGVVPALGYQVSAAGRTILFAGDQSAQSEAFAAAFAGSAPDLLVVHHVIPEGPGQPIGLHRPPSSMGELAGQVAPERLLLSHNMQRSLARLEEGLAQISAHYSGPVSVADDLDCFAF